MKAEDGLQKFRKYRIEGIKVVLRKPDNWASAG